MTVRARGCRVGLRSEPTPPSAYWDVKDTLKIVIELCVHLGYKKRMRRLVPTFLFLCSLFCTAVVWADTCADDNYKLTTQLEVNQLGSTGCDRVAGDLEIVDSPDIYNLEPLASIDEIQGT